MLGVQTIAHVLPCWELLGDQSACCFIQAPGWNPMEDYSKDGPQHTVAPGLVGSKDRRPQYKPEYTIVLNTSMGTPTKGLLISGNFPQLPCSIAATSAAQA